MEVWETVKKALESAAGALSALSASVTVTGRPLLPEEAIGRPEHTDYPLIKGREQMLEVEVLGSLGHAFTDGAGRFSGSVEEVLRLDPGTSFNRALLAATLNALMRKNGSVAGSCHCKDKGPVECAGCLPEAMEKFLEKNKVSRETGLVRIAMVGLQPRMAEALNGKYDLRITDLDADNIGKLRSGCVVGGPEQNTGNMAWCDAALVTGTTLTSGTIDAFLGMDRPIMFYGVTIGGAAKVMGIERFCPRSL